MVTAHRTRCGVPFTIHDSRFTSHRSLAIRSALVDHGPARALAPPAGAAAAVAAFREIGSRSGGVDALLAVAKLPMRTVAAIRGAVDAPLGAVVVLSRLGVVGRPARHVVTAGDVLVRSIAHGLVILVDGLVVQSRSSIPGHLACRQVATPLAGAVLAPR